jgi:hypothetical protein
MPVDPIYTQLLICERVITDTDGVPSAIRIADMFNVTPRPTVPPEQRPIVLSILFTAKFPHEDDTEHRAEIKLERPDGEVFEVGEAGGRLPETPPPIPKGFSFPARFGVFPTMMGVHYIIIVLDGKEVEKLPFILREHVSEGEQTETPSE